jgi:hypothetical protein
VAAQDSRHTLLVIDWLGRAKCLGKQSKGGRIGSTEESVLFARRINLYLHVSLGTGYRRGSDPKIPERAPFFFWRAAFSCSGSSPPASLGGEGTAGLWALDCKSTVQNSSTYTKHTPIPTNQSMYHSMRHQTGIPEQTTTLLYSTLCMVLWGTLSNILFHISNSV